MQDDVTDCSLSRRGLPTIHTIAREKAQLLDMHDPIQVGDNIAVYLADALYFLGQELLAQLEIDPVISLQLAAISARELAQLGLAQIEDLRCANLSSQTSELTQGTILQLYAGKTGRYSVSWPLQLGAVMAGSSADQLAALAKLGTEIGVLFQLRDDELGLFGNPDELGKSVDDDLRDGKKTLYWLALREQVDPADPLWQTFGSSTADTASIEKLRTHIRTAGIEQSVHDLITQKQTGLSTEIEASELTPPIKSLLTELLTFVVERKK
jgi:geranylgeranyl diphosphate synthase type I